jgi:hypothetical protein
MEQRFCQDIAMFFLNAKAILAGSPLEGLDDRFIDIANDKIGHGLDLSAMK